MKMINIKPIEEVYPNVINIEGVWDSEKAYSYIPMIKSFGYEILLPKNNEDDDTLVLFRCSDLYGVLLFEWGDYLCPYEALFECRSYEELDRIRQSMHSSIKWGSREEIIDYVHNLEWSLLSEHTEWRIIDFLREVKDILIKNNLKKVK